MEGTLYLFQKFFHIVFFPGLRLSFEGLDLETLQIYVLLHGNSYFRNLLTGSTSQWPWAPIHRLIFSHFLFPLVFGTLWLCSFKIPCPQVKLVDAGDELLSCCIESALVVKSHHKHLVNYPTPEFIVDQFEVFGQRFPNFQHPDDRFIFDLLLVFGSLCLAL